MDKRYAVPGLWKAIHGAKQIMTLRQLVEKNGYQFGHPEKMLRVGVDLSEMIDNILAVSPYVSLLKEFFFELCTFLENRVRVTFVQDNSGPDRHDKYRYSETLNQQYQQNGLPWWFAPCRELIESFGFNFHRAAVEADAELAKLNSLGLVDAIIVRDADVFALGATCLLRRSRNRHTYAVYTADALENVDDVHLTRGGIFLYSLLTGSRYSDPFEGLDRQAAFEFARSGLGDDLVNLMDTNTASGNLCTIPVAEFRAWATNFEAEMTSNSSGYLSSSLPALAARIQTSFPFHGVSLYGRPTTSWKAPFHPPDTGLWVPREPVISKMAELCSTHFGWTTALELAREFRSTVWTGVFIRLLASSDLVYDPSLKIFATPFHMSTARRIEFYNHPRSGKLKARLLLSTIPLMVHFNMDLSAINLDENDHLAWFWLTVPRNYLPANVAPFDGSTVV